MNLPQQINRIDVLANQTDLGLLTRGSAYHFQPTQLGRYASLTMINKRQDRVALYSMVYVDQLKSRSQIS